jgi:hypothetical protein
MTPERRTDMSVDQHRGKVTMVQGDHSLVDRLPLTAVPQARIKMMEGHAQGACKAILKWVGHDEQGVEESDQKIGEALRIAALWWIASDMVTLMDHAAPSMPSQELHPGDAPDLCGIVFFERPVAAVDPLPMDHRARVSAMVWHPSMSPVSAVLIDSYTFMEDRVGRRDWIYLGQSRWPVGVGIDDPSGNGWDDELQRVSVVEDRRRLAAVWTLSQQEGLASKRDVIPPRADRRRAERADVEPSSLRVVTLRRLTEHGGAVDPMGDRSYSHRWMVSGHWRNQYLPSRDTHRLQWIAPYVKGPEDKPLVLKETVKAWRR